MIFWLVSVNLSYRLSVCRAGQKIGFPCTWIKLCLASKENKVGRN